MHIWAILLSPFNLDCSFSFYTRFFIYFEANTCFHPHPFTPSCHCSRPRIATRPSSAPPSTVGGHRASSAHRLHLELAPLHLQHHNSTTPPCQPPHPRQTLVVACRHHQPPLPAISTAHRCRQTLCVSLWCLRSPWRPRFHFQVQGETLGHSFPFIKIGKTKKKPLFILHISSMLQSDEFNFIFNLFVTIELDSMTS